MVVIAEAEEFEEWFEVNENSDEAEDVDELVGDFEKPGPGLLEAIACDQSCLSKFVCTSVDLWAL